MDNSSVCNLYSDNRVADKLQKTEGLVCLEWRIKDFRTLFVSNSEQSRSLTSPTFGLRGASWSLQIFYCAINVEIAKKGLFIRLIKHQSDESYHRIKFQITLHVNETEICGGYRRALVFPESGACSDFVIGDLELFQRVSSVNDALTVVCNFYPIDEKSEDAKPYSSKNTKGIYILSSDMKNLLLNEENFDFVFKVKDKCFKVHKAMLVARSPVLAAMLQHDMAEKNSGTTSIDDCEPDVFQCFLLYLYSGQLENATWESVRPLYALADKYDLQHLKKKCRHFMGDHMTIAVFCDVFVLSMTYNEPMLLKCVEDFFVRHAEDILVTDEWELLMKGNHVACNELFLKYVKHGGKKY